MPEQRPHTRPAAYQTSSSKANLINILSVINLLGVALLLLALTVSVMSNRTSPREQGYVVPDKYQAVFLNNGQVYFGNIRVLNSQYIDLRNIYYLTQATVKNADGSTSAGDYSLEKLGCRQIHYPLDQMFINRSQVTFWENLDNNGKIVKSIQEFKKQNPKGPDCSQVSSQTQSANQPQQSGNQTPTQNSQTTPSTNTTPTTTAPRR